MIYQRCGNSSINLPFLSLDLSDSSEHKETDNWAPLFQEALNLGICHWDLTTALAEKQQIAETHLGSFLKKSSERDSLFLSSSISPRQRPFYRSNGRKGIRMEIDRLLNSLCLDYLDLFYIADPFKDGFPEETISAISTEISRGRVLYAGIWDMDTSDSQKWMDLLNDAGIPVLLHRCHYSPAQRQMERTLDHLLTMTHTSMTAIDGLKLPPGTEGAWSSLAAERLQTPEQLTISWLMRHSFVNSVTVPLSSPEKLQEYCSSMNNLSFDAEELKSIEGILG